MKVIYDPSVEAMTVEVTDREPQIPVSTTRANDSVLLDYDRGDLHSIELLSPRPRPQLAAIAAEHGFAHQLDDIYALIDSALGWSINGDARFSLITISR